MNDEIENKVLNFVRVSDPSIEEAEQYFVKSVLSDKNNFFSYFNYASFLFQLKRYGLAEKCYLHCLKINPTFLPALEGVKKKNFLI